jgi:hypothetical protein
MCGNYSRRVLEDISITSDRKREVTRFRQELRAGKREERDTVISDCAGVCRWCLEAAFAALGVLATPKAVGVFP